MILTFNNGKQVDMPYLVFNEGVDGYWSYRENSSYCAFRLFGSYMDKLDEMGVGFSNEDQVYNLCQDVRYWHSAEYYAEGGTGYNNIQTLLANSVWIYGDEDNGGILLTKVRNKYGFIAFDGVFEGDDETMYAGTYRYGYQTDINRISGHILSRTELELSTIYFSSYDNNQIYIMYQPDNEAIKRYEYPKNPVASITEEVTDLIKATDNAQFYLAANLQMHPYVWWIVCMPDGTSAINDNYFPIATVLEFTDFHKVGGSIFDESFIDETANPYANGGTATNGGGGGKWSSDSDSTPVPTADQFTVDAINSGFLTLYNPTEAQVRSFNDFLFSGITEDMSAVLKRLVVNPLEYVIFLAQCHFSPPVKTGTYDIKFCGISSGVQAKKVDKQMLMINCGNIILDETKETASFLSYNPYFKITAFLPYIGHIVLNTDDVMGGTLNVKYWIDLLTGSCTAFLSVTRANRGYLGDVSIDEVIIGSYTGNCYLNMPLTSSDWRGLFSSMVQFAGGLISTAGGNASGLGAMASAVLSDKISVSRSGQLGSNFGYMGYQMPYLLLERPIEHLPENFGAWEGFPSNIKCKIGELSGYTELDQDTLWTDGFDDITDEECEMLRNITSRGFYVN